MTTTVEHGCYYLPAPTNGGPLQEATRKVGAWAWQPKVDDWRAKIHVPTGTVWNQYGQLSTPAQQGKLDTALDKLRQFTCGNFEWLDAGIMENRHDMMRGSIVVFDWITPGLTYEVRRDMLATYLEPLPLASKLLAAGNVEEEIYLVPSWTENRDGLLYYGWLQQENATIGRKFYEGLVAKRLDSTYPLNCLRPKQTVPCWIKHRFDQGL